MNKEILEELQELLEMIEGDIETIDKGGVKITTKQYMKNIHNDLKEIVDKYEQQ